MSIHIDPLNIARHLESVKNRIATACAESQRPIDSVKLLAVSKGFSSQAINELKALGQNAFCENYLQEALEKIKAASPAENDLTGQVPFIWHFIGQIQSNKAKKIAQHFDWVQSVASMETATLLSQHRPPLAPLNVCIQVNISQEKQKNGLHSDHVSALAIQLQDLPNIHLRGLMAIPSSNLSPESRWQIFQQMHALFLDLRRSSRMIDTLSLGMSDDLEMAIKAGSTCVRIGRAIFGERP